MGYQYALQLTRDTLRHLARPDDLDERLVRAVAEIDILRSGDTSEENFKRVKELKEMYYSKSWVEESKDITKQEKLAQELVDVCVDIIEHNSNSRNRHSVK